MSFVCSLMAIGGRVVIGEGSYLADWCRLSGTQWLLSLVWWTARHCGWLEMVILRQW